MIPGSLHGPALLIQRKHVIRLAVSVLIGCIFSSTAAAGDLPAAFKPGERLVYRLRWAIVDAGEAVVQVLPMKTIQGNTVYHFKMTARSNAFIDAFYKVRDKIEAFADADLTHSVRYLKEQREGSTERDVTIEFDWESNIARYTKIEKEGTEKKDTPLMPGSFDPLSAFFYVRAQPFAKGSMIERPITDGNKNVIGQVRVIRRQSLTVAGKKYDTFLIEPDLKHVGGVFEKSDDAKIQIWVTADHRRIPVRLKSKVVVGSFVGDLVEASGL